MVNILSNCINWSVRMEDNSRMESRAEYLCIKYPGFKPIWVEASKNIGGGNFTSIGQYLADVHDLPISSSWEAATYRARKLIEAEITGPNWQELPPKKVRAILAKVAEEYKA